MIVLNLAHYRIVEKFGDERRRVVYRARDEQNRGFLCESETLVWP